MTTHNLWYVRRNNKIVGPFPRAQLMEYLSQGKLVQRDEVSRDQQKWLRIEQCPDFQPDEKEVKSVLHRLWYVRKDNQVTGPFPQAQIAESLNRGELGRGDEISHDGAAWVSIEQSGYFQSGTASGKAAHRLWYVRRHGRMAGPFPKAQIAEYLLVGKLSRSDEISEDKAHWGTIQQSGQFPIEQTSEQLAAATPEENAWETERARAKHRWLDERLYADGEALTEAVTGGDTYETLRHDNQVTQAMVMAAREQRPKLIYGVVAFIVIGLMVAGVWYGGKGQGLTIVPPQLPSSKPDCNAKGATVNWEGCVKTGIDLRGAKMKQSNFNAAKLDNADFSGADLSYATMARASLRAANMEGAILQAADFRGADLTGANLGTSDLRYADFVDAKIDGLRLEGAKLDRASWIDGRICAEGSVGECL